MRLRHGPKVELSRNERLVWRVSWSFRAASVGNCGDASVLLGAGLAFRVAGVGNRGACACEKHNE